jgi:hypothetical protein
MFFGVDLDLGLRVARLGGREFFFPILRLDGQRNPHRTILTK